MEAGGVVSLPVLRTERLVLNAFTPADVPRLVPLANRPEIAATTLAIPHPYTEDDARRFLALIELEHRNGSALTLAIRLAEGATLVGAIGLKDIDDLHSHAELGYWIGVDWWGKRIATEAARAVVAYAFDCRGLNRVAAHHLVRNPASGAVLERIGMRREGMMRQRVFKEGRFEDVVLYAMLRSDPRPA